MHILNVTMTTGDSFVAVGSEVVVDTEETTRSGVDSAAEALLRAIPDAVLERIEQYPTPDGDWTFDGVLADILNQKAAAGESPFAAG